MITTRLQLASRIQLLLFRELGEKIDIELMLANERYARDVLLLCESLGTNEFAGLAQRYRDVLGTRATREPEPIDWVRPSSGFDSGLPPEKAPAPAGGWLAATRRWPRW